MSMKHLNDFLFFYDFGQFTNTNKKPPRYPKYFRFEAATAEGGLFRNTAELRGNISINRSEVINLFNGDVFVLRMRIG